MKYDSKGFPHQKYRYFLYNPGENAENAMTFYASKEERDAAAEELVRDYIDEDGWWPEVEDICVGEVTGMAQAVDKVERPPDSVEEGDGGVDEDGFDGEGNYWGGEHDFMCNYKVLPLPEVGDEKEKT